MSGGGGFYKYRCKNWLTYDCTEWVWVNGTACVNCLVSATLPMQAWSIDMSSRHLAVITT